MVNHILADTAIKAVINDRLFPLAIPQEENIPAIVYQRISSPRTLTLSGDSVNNPRIQLSCYGASYGTAKQLAILLYQSLDCFRGALGNKVKATLLMDDSRDGFDHETKRYRSDVDFFIMHTKPKGG